MKSAVLIGLLCLAACGTRNEPLAMVKDKDPVVQLNPDRWTATVNDLTTPPDDGRSRPLPPPVRATRDMAVR